MRSRSRVVTVPGGVIPRTYIPYSSHDEGVTWEAGAPYSNPYTTSGSLETRDETMSDELGFGLSNRCSHTKWVFDPSSSAFTWIYRNRGVPSTNVGLDIVHDLNAVNWMVLNGQSPRLLSLHGNDWAVEHKPVDIGRLYSGLLNQLRASPSGFYGIEFMKDLIHTYTTLTRPWRPGKIDAVRNVLRYFGVSQRSSLGGIKKALSTTSNSYLAWKFGVQPLVSDFRHVLSAGETLKKRAGRVAMKDGRVRVAYQYPLMSTLVKGSSTYDTTPTFFKELSLFEQRGIMSGTALLKPGRATFTSAEILIDHFRLTDFIGLGWELVPFSFVADWFLHIDDLIQSSLNKIRFECGPFSEIQGINVSSLVRKKYRVNYRGLSMTEARPLDTMPPRVVLGDLTYTEYKRNIGVVTQSTPLLSGLDASKIITGGALAVQRFLRS